MTLLKLIELFKNLYKKPQAAKSLNMPNNNSIRFKQLRQQIRKFPTSKLLETFATSQDPNKRTVLLTQTLNRISSEHLLQTKSQRRPDQLRINSKQHIHIRNYLSRRTRGQLQISCYENFDSAAPRRIYQLFGLAM